ncbi:cubilin-like [Branchiostoma floridae x Branchiostoma belcheri]
MDSKPSVVLYRCGMGHLVVVPLLLFLFTAEPLVSGACLEEGFGDSGCDSFRNLLSDCGHIQTAGFPLAPYKNDTVCEWHVHVRPRHRIVLVFDRFELEESGVTCEYDQLSIHDGVNEKAPKLGTFCGRYDSFKVLSSRNHLYLKFTSDESIAAAGFYASYISEDVGHEAHQAVVDMGRKTFPCPGSLNMTGNEMTSSTPEQFLLQSELRERMWILWDPWGAVDGNYLRIYEGDNTNTAPALVDNFRHEAVRSFSPKGHQIILSLLLRNRDGGAFVQCFIEDITDELPFCFPDQKNTNIGYVVFDKNVFQEPDDIDLHCKVPVKTAINQQLLASVDLVNNPTISARQEKNNHNTRVALYDKRKRLGFLTSMGPEMALSLPTLTSGNELLIILWADSATLHRAQWIPEVQYSPTACQDLSRQLRKNGTTTTQAPCGMFRHLPNHDFTNYDYRVRIETTDNMYVEVLLPPLSRYDGIRFMCKGMKSGCDEDLQIYDLQGNSPVLIYSYCRETDDDWKTIRSSSHAVEVVYRSFCTWSRSGFYFSFRTTECTWMPAESCNQRQDLQAPCGFFQPPSHTDLERQSLVCDWKISPPPGNKVVITFQNLSLTADQKGEDFILIQELGDDGTFQTVMDIRQSYPLFSVESTSSEVLVKFVKDRIGTKKDAVFTAFYTTTKVLTPSTGPFEMEDLCESGFQYYRSNCYRVVINREKLSWETAQQR